MLSSCKVEERYEAGGVLGTSRAADFIHDPLVGPGGVLCLRQPKVRGTRPSPSAQWYVSFSENRKVEAISELFVGANNANQGAPKSITHAAPLDIVYFVWPTSSVTCLGCLPASRITDRIAAANMSHPLLSHILLVRGSPKMADTDLIACLYPFYE
jgi:hypothetical protein